MRDNGAEPEGPDSDRGLVARARAGDAFAVERLVRRHIDTAFAVAFAIVGDRDEAEDVCQEAVLRALDRLGDCRHPERFGAWLGEIARNHAHSRRAYRKVREALPIAEDSASARGMTSDDAERQDLRSRLETALRGLS
jgi:RNA polymerase sigma factor (sigma-70 family)